MTSQEDKRPPVGQDLGALVARLPKAELHVHIEGTLEPEMMLAMAKRNGIHLPYASVEEARAARADYSSLEDFLAEYCRGGTVLLTEQDFFELAEAYLAKAAQQGVRHAEIFFDPQQHVTRDVSWNVFFPGLERALRAAPEKHGMSAALIMCFMRDLGPQSAAETLEQAVPYLAHISGVGLDAAEVGIDPSTFGAVFESARQLGLHRVAHAGEEGGPEYVWGALDSLGVERIDHGVHSIEDPCLMQRLEALQLPLTTCPISNQQLKVFEGTIEQRYQELLASGLAITLNSDDPAYFGAYINENYLWALRVAGLSGRQLADLAKRSFHASFIGAEEKARYIQEVEDVLLAWEAEHAQHA